MVPFLSTHMTQQHSFTLAVPLLVSSDTVICSINKSECFQASFVMVANNGYELIFKGGLVVGRSQ